MPRHRRGIRGWPDDAVACISIRVSENVINNIPYGVAFDWSDIINWFDETDILIFTWSSFTSEWNRDFVLTRHFTDTDRVEFALRFG